MIPVHVRVCVCVVRVGFVFNVCGFVFDVCVRFCMLLYVVLCTIVFDVCMCYVCKVCACVGVFVCMRLCCVWLTLFLYHGFFVFGICVHVFYL